MTNCAISRSATSTASAMLIHVRHGKGRATRRPLTPVLLEGLRIYWHWLQAETRLVVSLQATDHHDALSDKTVCICNQAAERAGVKKHVGPHMFRHSCATHLLDAGTDLRTIQVLLGHADISKHRRYLRVSTVRLQAAVNPLDRLALKTVREFPGSTTTVIRARLWKWPMSFSQRRTANFWSAMGADAFDLAAAQAYSSHRALPHRRARRHTWTNATTADIEAISYQLLPYGE